jgi:dTMP kinase
MESKKEGYFITVEGPDGSGKSTVVKSLTEWIEKYFSNPVIMTKEPGSPLNSTCKKIRELVLSPDNDIDPEAELYLMMADRCNHVNKVIKPALENNSFVISDRYMDSTYAYQGWGRRNGNPEALEYINLLNKMSTGGLIPNLTILLMVDPEVGLQRVTTTEFGKKDRFENEKIEFHKRLHQGFSDLYEKYKSSRHFILIDTTNMNIKEVSDEVITQFADSFSMDKAGDFYS